jgi:allantoinase
VLIDPSKSFTLAAADLHQRHQASPFTGRTFRGVVRRTIRRGETIALDGQIVARTKGHFVAPVRSHA